MSNWFRPIVFAIWGVLLIPMIGITLERWLQESVFSGSNAVATAISNDLVAVSQLRWFNLALVFMTGVVIGVSFETLARKSGERKAFEVRSLGYKFRSLSEKIKITSASSGWPDDARDLRSAIASAFSSARKFDLWAPTDQVYELPDASFLCEYFKCVGGLLENGCLDEAGREALSWKPFLDRAKP
jgi:hypothetical protein